MADVLPGVEGIWGWQEKMQDGLDAINKVVGEKG
jgi:hypothetical protein